MKKPRFRVGQMVVVRDGYFGSGSIGHVMAHQVGKDNVEAFVMFPGISDWYVEWQLRPLTARERGPIRHSGKRRGGKRT